MYRRLIKNNVYKFYFFIKKLNYFIFDFFYFQKSYSLEGEDLLINGLLEFKKNGFYVDIGAYHPVKFSNTNLFYKNGWQGINIDAMPGSMRVFNLKRRRDINLEIPISDCPLTLIYYIFDSGAYNTFSKELAEKNIVNSCLLKKVELKTQTLASILGQYVPDNQQIDFFSIDVEGYDLNVLKSNDWEKYKPRFILVEDHDFSLEMPTTSQIYNYLSSQGYKLVTKTKSTVIYQIDKFF